MSNNQNPGSKHEVLQILRKNIVRQALLAGFLILLTVVLLFAVTTAWYTNVAQTSGLMFEVAAWGFDGDIWVADNPIIAGPGDKGGVYLTLENDSENVVDVSVYADRSSLGPEISKRLYFYVESSDVINGETVEKVYLTNGNGYEYTVIGKGNLTLTENYHNDAQIKWEWVYDVLGYYVIGQLNTNVEYVSLLDANGPEAIMDQSADVKIEEYLRPIEYDYDSAKTTFREVAIGDRNVKLVDTIDGTTTVDEFVAQITAHDGYPEIQGAATPRTPEGFYPVSVNEQGYGVWLYLCNYSEIEAATAFDTLQGETAAKGNAAQHKVVLNISAQKSDLETTTVNIPAQLSAELEKDGLSVVQLSADMSIDTLAIPDGKDIVLDLNGKKLTYTNTNGEPMMDLGEGSSLTVYNGTIEGPGVTDSVAFHTNGAEMTFTNVTATGIDTFVNVDDSTGIGVDSRVRIVKSNITASDMAVFLKGNGTMSSNRTELVLEDSVVYGDYMGIVGSGNDPCAGTDITIINSQVKGRWASIYHPQQESYLNVVGSKLEGYTGIVLKGGYTTLTRCKILGTGVANEPAYSGSGFADTGDGVYLEANYTWVTDVQIYDCTVSSDYAQAVRKFMDREPNASITIHSGKFNSDVSSYVAPTSSIGTNSDVEWVVTVLPTETQPTESTPAEG